MSYRHTAYALDAAERLDLSARAAHVLLVIAVHADRFGVAWPSVARLAGLARRHRSNVLLALAELERAGALAVERRHGRASRYRLPILDVLSTTGSASATGAADATGSASATDQWRERYYTSGARATRTGKRTGKEQRTRAPPRAGPLP